jgi:light-regulated signal transduction histidine kinase (bacteriophytochrome)
MYVASDEQSQIKISRRSCLPRVKYRGQEPLRIRIEAAQEDTFWRVSVSDNGQEFQQEFAATIFEPFKRLHGKNVPGRASALRPASESLNALVGAFGQIHTR